MKFAKQHIALLTNLALVLYALVLYAWSQGAMFVDPFVINGDTSLVTAWFYQYFGEAHFVESDIYPIISEVTTPWGYSALHAAFCYIMDPLDVSRVLPLLVLIPTVLLLHRLLRLHLGRAMALVGVVLISTAYFFLIPFPGGFPRAFAFLLLLAGLILLGNRSYKMLSVLMVLTALIYPVAFLLQAGITLLDVAVDLWRTRKQFQFRACYLWVGASVGVGLGLLLAKAHSIESHELLGEMYSKAEITSMPEFGPSGRVRITPLLDTPDVLHLAKWFTQGFDFFRWIDTRAKYNNVLLPALTLLIFALTAWRIRKSGLTRLDRLMAMLAGSGIVLFFAAQQLLLMLYIPTRYLKYSLSLVAVILLLQLIQWIAEAHQKKIVIAALVLLPVLAYQTYNVGLGDFNDKAPLYTAIEELPGNPLIAGVPVTCDMVPILSRKSVFVSHEVSHAVVYKNAWSIIKPRTWALLEAYLTDDPTVLVDFINKHNIDYIIIEDEFLESMRKVHFEPFNAYIQETKEARKNGSYALLNVESKFLKDVQPGIRLLDGKAFAAQFR